uniref:Trans-1,2-dihydrobenzene-1,2-diol dehydrogenase n=1 Tax=Meleagris gallopavo TaxID=9103 RepID=H9H0T4_MELGA
YCPKWGLPLLTVLLAPSGVSFSLTGFSLSPLVSPHPPAPDVVYVGTVNPQHLPDTLLFLRARKAVLVEKPMGISAREAKEMAAAAREAGVFLMEGFWTRFFPAWKRLKALVDEGALGECRVLQGALAFPLRSVERVREPSLAGGALLDLGGYGLQIGQRLVGEGVPTPTATGRGLPGGVSNNGKVPKQQGGEVHNDVVRGSPVMPLAESELIAEMMDEARRQVGAVGPGGTAP